MNKSDFATRLAALGVTFDKPVTTELAEIYYRALSTVPDDRLDIGFQRAITELRFFPKPAELRELSGCGAVAIEGQAFTEWGRVVESIARYGRCGEPDFTEPTKGIIRSMGGWRYLCTRTFEQLNEWDRKKFIEHYNNRVTSGNLDGPALTSRERKALTKGER